MAQREEVATQGMDFAVVRQDRAVGGVKTTVFKVDGASGAVGIAGRKIGTPDITVGAKIVNARIVTIQLKDTMGNALTGLTAATVWVSATAGAVPATSITGLATTITTGILLVSPTAVTVHQVVSDVNGVIGVTLDDPNGTQTYFVNVAVGDMVASSGAVTLT